MGTDLEKSYLRGFGVPLGLTTAHIGTGAVYAASYTERSPITGAAEPQSSSTTLRLRTSGNQSDGGRVVVRVHRGNPAPGSFIWKDGTASGIEYRGRDLSVITGYKNVFRDDATYAGVLRPHIATHPSGQVVAVAQTRTGGAATGRVDVKTYDPLTDQWSSATTLYDTLLVGDGLWPCVAHDPLTGHMYVAHWVPNTIENEAGIRLHRGEWDGSSWTWSVHSTQALDVLIDTQSTIGSGNAGYDTEKIRLCFSPNGQALLMCALVQHNNNLTDSYINALAQYASTDGGASFQQVDIGRPTGAVFISTIAAAIDFSLFMYEGSFVFAGFSVYASGYNDSITFIKLPTATTPARARYEAIDPADTFGLGTTNLIFDNTTSNNGGQHDLSRSCVWVDEDGHRLWALAVCESGTTYEAHTVLFTSDDGGSTWKFTGDGDRQATGTARFIHGTIIDSTGNNSHLTHPSAVSVYGRQMLIAGHNDTSGNTSDHINTLMIGGSTTINAPALASTPLPYQQDNWNICLLPVEDYGNLSGISRTTSGTNTVVLADRGIDLTSNSSSGVYKWGDTLTTDSEHGVVVQLDYDPATGGDTANKRRYLQIIVSDGSSSSYEVSIRASTTQFAIVDEVASSTVATSAAKSTGDGVQILIAVANGKVSCWERTTSTATTEAETTYDRDWTEVANGATISERTTSVPASSSLEWGHDASSSLANIQTIWGLFAYVQNTDYTKQLAAGHTSPDDLIGREFPRRAHTVLVDDDVSITTLDGYPHEGDEFHIDQDAEYPLRYALHNVMPTRRVSWQSQAHNVSQFIPLKINPDEATGATTAGRLNSDLIYVALLNTNISQFTLKYLDAGGTWQTWKAIDTRLSVDNARLRNGVVFINAAGTNTKTDKVQIHANEFAGCEMHLSSTRLLIDAHTGGKLDDSASHLLPRFQVSGDDGTSALSAALSIIPKDVVIVINTAGIQYRGIGIDISAQTTYTGTYRIGTLDVGHVMVFGEEYGWGRVMEGVAGTVTDDGPDGVRRSNDLAPGYRQAVFGWTFPVELSDLFGDDPDPDYTSSSSQAGNGPVSAENDAPYNLLNLIQTHGAGKPLIYLPSIPRSTSSGTEFVVLSRKHQHLYGHMDSSIRLESVLGAEDRGRESGTQYGEIVRVANVTIREAP